MSIDTLAALIFAPRLAIGSFLLPSGLGKIIDPAHFAAGDMPIAELKRGGDPQLLARFRMGLINHGVDLMRGKSAFVSAAHTPADIDQTIAAFDAALHDATARD